MGNFDNISSRADLENLLDKSRDEFKEKTSKLENQEDIKSNNITWMSRKSSKLCELIEEYIGPLAMSS